MLRLNRVCMHQCTYFLSYHRLGDDFVAVFWAVEYPTFLSIKLPTPGSAGSLILFLKQRFLSCMRRPLAFANRRARSWLLPPLKLSDENIQQLSFASRPWGTQWADTAPPPNGRTLSQSPKTMADPIPLPPSRTRKNTAKPWNIYGQSWQRTRSQSGCLSLRNTSSA